MATLMIIFAVIVCMVAGATIVAPLVDRRWPAVGRSVVIIGSAMVVPLTVMLLAVASLLYTLLNPDCPRYTVCGGSGLVQFGLVVLSIATLVGGAIFGATSAYMKIRLNRPDDDVQDADSDALS